MKAVSESFHLSKDAGFKVRSKIMRCILLLFLPHVFGYFLEFLLLFFTISFSSVAYLSVELKEGT